MASKLDTDENNAALARGNLMSVKEALDAGLTENEIKKLIKMVEKGEDKLTNREQSIVRIALEKATKKRNELLRQVNKVNEQRRLMMEEQVQSFDPNAIFNDGAGADILMPEQVQSDEARNLTASPLPTAAALEEARTSPFEPMDIDNRDMIIDPNNMFGGKRKRKRRKRKTKRRKRKTKKRKGGRYLACLCKKKRRSTGGKKRRRRKTRRRKK